MPSNERTPNPVAGSGVQMNSADTSTYSTYDGVEEQAWLQVGATRYARHGFPVFPMSRRKMPYSNLKVGQSLLPPRVIAEGEGGFKVATTNLEQITKWWGKDFPGANIGVRPPAGWVVLDIDPRNGGDATWEQINHGHTLPDTIVTLTGSGGWHWWFQLPYPGEIRGSAGEGIDVKTSRGYVVMPPSIHPTTGDRYVLKQWVDPRQVPVLPEWLRKHVYRPLPTPRPARRVGDTTGSGLVEAVEGAVEGQRNSVLFWAACRALEDGMDLEAELTTAARGIGLDDREITTALGSARREMGGGAAA